MGAITGQSSLIFVFHPIRLRKKQGRADMLAAFSTKDLEKKPSRRTETFQAVSTNISSKMPTAFLVQKAKEKKKKGVVGQNSRWKGKAQAQSRWPSCNATRLCTLPGPKGKAVMNSLFSLLRHLCFKVRLTTQTSKMATSHCCVPSCSNDSRYNKYLSFHALPSDAKTRAEWIVKIRRDRTPNFEVGFDHF